jgi:hypothetical protein
LKVFIDSLQRILLTFHYQLDVLNAALPCFVHIYCARSPPRFRVAVPRLPDHSPSAAFCFWSYSRACVRAWS